MLMGLALYRKYRSKSFDDVVGQDHITRTLKKSVDNETFSHAYLLTGLRGVGKTSIARIFAAYVNGISYEESENNPDIIEIDAASNRKIDEIRDLREKVNIAPTSLKFKVYIIDEVHMLTREAFNALLKTLEEPPRHCILILATTDYHKLPETIISRCIRFSFKSISDKDITERLVKIAGKEKITIDNEALQTISKNSSGSMRDAITILDQARNITDKITASDIETLLGLANTAYVKRLYESVEAKSSKDIVQILEEIKNSGANPQQVISQFTRHIRNKIISGQNSVDLLKLLTEIIKINEYSDKWLVFEVYLLKYAVSQKKPAGTDNQIHPIPASTEDLKAELDDEPGQKTKEIKSNTDLWQKVLEELKKTNSTLYGVARMAEVSTNGSMLELKLKFNFHKKQLDIKRNQAKIVEIINKHSAKITAITTVIVAENSTPEVKNSYDSSKDVSNISNVFGSAEMLE